jgi:endonuclease/exonuclease/phosphatase family metal-dependent hydrolase
VKVRHELLAAVFWVVALVACRGGPDEPGGTTTSSTSSTTSQADAGPEPGLRIATFNVRRYFDTVCDSGNCEPGAYEEQPTQEQFDARTAQIAEALERIDASIVLLQEVETWTCLLSLASAVYPRYPTIRLGEIGGVATVDVAVLAEGDLVQEIRHRQTPIPLPSGGTTTFARELLELHLEVDGQLVVVFDAHFKSKSNDDPERRLAEAMAAREIVTARANEQPEALVILGGDLNDTPGSPPLDALEEGGWLHRVASDLPEGEDSTFLFNGQGVALDHLYRAIAAAGSYLPGSAEVVHGGAFALGGSDHAAMAARFALPE